MGSTRRLGRVRRKMSRFSRKDGGLNIDPGTRIGATCVNHFALVASTEVLNRVGTGSSTTSRSEGRSGGRLEQRCGSEQARLALAIPNLRSRSEFKAASPTRTVAELLAALSSDQTATGPTNPQHYGVSEMQFMVTVRLDSTKAKDAPPKELSEAEFEAVRGLYMSGLLRQIWIRADKSGAIILAEADTIEAVAEAFSTLPMVREGVLKTPEVVELAPYFGFAPRV